MLHKVIIRVQQLSMLPFHSRVHRLEMDVHVEVDVLFDGPVLDFQVLDVLLDLGFLGTHDFTIVASYDYGVYQHLF